MFLFLLLAEVLGSIEDQKQLMEDWDKYMRGFQPDDMISFKVDQGSEEIFVEKITQPTIIRGTYFIPLYTQDTIDFKVIDPSGVMIYAKLMKKEAVFSVNVTQLGDYQLIFTNKRAKEDKIVTLAIDVGQSEKEELSSQDIDPIENSVYDVNQRVKDIFYGTKLSQMRSNNAYNQMKSANQRLMYLTFLETFAICGVTFWQVWFIKNLLKDSSRLV
ncbi:hypothetical protein pb186bvf_015661 [Paramecium bursaria]